MNRECTKCDKIRGHDTKGQEFKSTDQNDTAQHILCHFYKYFFSSFSAFRSLSHIGSTSFV